MCVLWTPVPLPLDSYWCTAPQGTVGQQTLEISWTSHLHGTLTLEQLLPESCTFTLCSPSRMFGMDRSLGIFFPKNL